MTLTLTHTQRLNLVVLLGLQEANVSETRAIWKLQDTLNLSDQERAEIGLMIQNVPGGEAYSWDLTKDLPIKEYDLPEADLARLERAVQSFPRHRVQLARPWLEPLLAQLPQSMNGKSQ